MKRSLLLQELAGARRARIEPEPWIPTEEEKAAMADGSLIVIPIVGGPRIYIDLRAGRPAKSQQLRGPAVTEKFDPV